MQEALDLSFDRLLLMMMTVPYDGFANFKAVPLLVRSGPDGSKNLKFPDCVTMAQDGGKVVSLAHRPLLPPVNTHGTHFCRRLSRPQGYSEIRRILCQ